MLNRDYDRINTMKNPKLKLALATATVLLIASNCGSEKKQAEPGLDSEIATESPATQESGGNESDADIKGKPIGVRSGIIEYTYSGDRTGKSTQYFDDYGMKSAVYAEMVQQGQESKGWVVTIGEDQYMWDMPNTGQGMKAKNPMIKMMMETPGKEIEAYTEEMYQKMGMSKSGTETFQGKECTVFSGDMGKVLIWKGLLMKMEMNMGSVVSGQEVTSIKTNIPVAERYFRIPDNITFNQIPGF